MGKLSPNKLSLPMYTTQQSIPWIQLIKRWTAKALFLGGFVDKRLVDVRDHTTTSYGSFYKGV
jgi:hypothetical protein